MRHERFLLAETDESVTSIAFACGFEDLSKFFRVFRQQEKIAPGLWREKHEKKQTRRKIE